MSEESTARAAKRRILKTDNDSDERQMLLGVSPTMRRTSKLNDDQRSPDTALAGQEPKQDAGDCGGTGSQGRQLGSELKVLQRMLGDELRGLRQEFSSLVRTHHQELSSELRAVQLAVTADIKGGQSTIASRLERMSALLEHNSRVDAVGAKMPPLWRWLGRRGVVVATIIATILVLMFGFGILG